MRFLAALAALVVLGACTTRDRNELDFGAPVKVASASGVQAIAVDGAQLYYGVFDSGEVYKVNVRKPTKPTRLATLAVRAKGANGLMGLAVRDGELFASLVRPDRRLVVVRVLGGATVWQGPEVNSLQREGHLAVGPDGRLYISVGGRIEVALGDGAVVSDGWVNPFAFSVDDRDRIFVADQPRVGETKAVVARGRERNRSKRERFATGLEGTKPSGLALVGDEVLVCRSNVGDVFRLHIGLDNTARRRSNVDGVKCRNAIAVMNDGSVVTALAHEIRRYPPA